MNFATIAQLKNQKDTNNYPVRLQMFATINEIGGIQANQKGTTFCKVKLTDDNGEKHSVTLYNTVPPMNLVNTRQIFALSSFTGTYNGQPYTGFSGFWQDGNQQQGRQQAPQQAQQPRHQAPAGKAPPASSRDSSIERQCAWKTAGTVAASRPQFTFEDAIKWAQGGLYFIETGGDLTKMPPWNEQEPQGTIQQEEPNGPPPTNDDVPF